MAETQSSGVLRGKRNRNWKICGLLLAGLAATITQARAAENAAGFYLLGGRGPGAGVLAPEGLYFQNTGYLYGGGLSGSRTLPVGGNIAAGLRGTILGDFATVQWVTPWQILGGRIAFNGSLAIGGPWVRADVIVGPLSRTRSDNTFTIGDPVFGATIGWNVGKLHVSANASVNTPVGQYNEGALANISFHRWAGDLTLAATWLDPTLGVDISGAVGITFNGMNPVTQYRTGTEFHAEWALSKNLTKEWTVGLVGYHYQQVTGDSGAGAVLGDFKGRVTALGGMVAYNFTAWETPMQASVKVYREFNTMNRLQGTAGFLTISMPLYMPGAPVGLLRSAMR